MMGRRFPVWVVFALAMSGCYDSFVIAEGERYQCECSYGVNLLDTSGTPYCTATSTSMAAPRSSNVINPCLLYETTPEEACDAACAEWAVDLFCDVRSEVAEARYTGLAECGADEIYLFPNVPREATRNGFVNASLSTLTISIPGFLSGGIPLEDGTPASITGGDCTDYPVIDTSGGPGCRFSVTQLEIRQEPGILELVGGSIEGLEIDLAEIHNGLFVTSTEGEPETFPNDWAIEVLTGRTDDPRGPFDDAYHGPMVFDARSGEVCFDGDCVPEVAFEVQWGEVVDVTDPTMVPTDNPHGELLIREEMSSPQFVTFLGKSVSSVPVESGDDLEVTINWGIVVDFLTGSPLPIMAVVDEGTDIIELDARASFPTTGGEIIEHWWIALGGDYGDRPTEDGDMLSPNQYLVRLARGERAWITRAEFEEVYNNGAQLCLRSFDVSGLYRDVCWDGATVPPIGPPMDCEEAVRARPQLNLSAELLDLLDPQELAAIEYKSTWVLAENRGFGSTSYKQRVTVDGLVQQYGADLFRSSVFRAYIPFGPFSDHAHWNPKLLGSFSAAGRARADDLADAADTPEVVDVPCGEGSLLHTTRHAIRPW